MGFCAKSMFCEFWSNKQFRCRWLDVNSILQFKISCLRTVYNTTCYNRYSLSKPIDPIVLGSFSLLNFDVCDEKTSKIKL